MIITAIDPQKKRQDRVNIFLDGNFAFGLSLDLIWEHHLKINTDLSSDEISKIRTADAITIGYDKALSYLTGRPRSTHEVRQQLRDKLIYHHPDFVEQTEHTKELFIETQTASIEVIIQKLQANNLIDDATFAKWWIQNRQTFQPRGKRLLLLELKTKGVSDLDIATALTTPNEEGHFHSEVKESAPPSESDTALLLAQTFLRKHPRITPKEYSTKVARHLASKGFDWDTIKQALTRLNQQTQ